MAGLPKLPGFSFSDPTVSFNLILEGILFVLGIYKHFCNLWSSFNHNRDNQINRLVIMKMDLAWGNSTTAYTYKRG